MMSLHQSYWFESRQLENSYRNLVQSRKSTHYHMSSHRPTMCQQIGNGPEFGMLQATAVKLSLKQISPILMSVRSTRKRVL